MEIDVGGEAIQKTQRDRGACMSFTFLLSARRDVCCEHNSVIYVILVDVVVDYVCVLLGQRFQLACELDL